MRYAVFSDVHANLPALEKFVDSTRFDVDAYICLGDVVNYGPFNDECLELVCSLPGIVYLDGNHERLFRGDDAIDHELPLVQAFFEHSRASFTRYDLIAHLPPEFETGSFSFAHTLEDRRIFPDSDVELSKNWFIGHSHHQFRTERNGWTLINCGSVGQNRRTIDVSNYAIYDGTTGEVQLRELAFDFASFIRELQARNYPAACIEYYARKPRQCADVAA